MLGLGLNKMIINSQSQLQKSHRMNKIKQVRLYIYLNGLQVIIASKSLLCTKSYEKSIKPQPYRVINSHCHDHI